jgi:NitT/TauT family transport system permease protein
MTSDKAAGLTPRLFKLALPILRPFSWGDAVVLAGLAVLVYGGIRLGTGAPEIIRGPEIQLAPAVLPYYVSLSLGRMTASYGLSLAFSLVFGYLASRSSQAERIFIPLFDVLQSIPILSFLPITLLSLTAILPQGLAVELTSIVLIFTSQAWNLAFAWYQSLLTIPRTLSRVSVILRFNPWLRFKTLEFPFAAVSLVWNTVSSWAGGWFFLMAAEIFSAGDRNFRLPGLGAYLQEAANQGDHGAIAWGLLALITTIVILDQLVWRPLIAWSSRFTLQTVASDNPPTSWFYNVLKSAGTMQFLHRTVFRPWGQRLDDFMVRLLPVREVPATPARSRSLVRYGLWIVAGPVLLWGSSRCGQMLLSVTVGQWGEIVLGLAMTFLRVVASLAIALGWTIPLGVFIGTNPRVAAWLQPLAQIAASIPATALFPVLLLLVAGLPGGLNVAAVLLMLLGTQWYLLFNIIAGASAIPRDLQSTAALLQLGRWERWKTLILPAIFPYAVTGALAASGGAWNASVVAEYAQFGGQTLQTTGVGALIATATAQGDYPLLLAATLTLIITVIIINRLWWRRLYQLAEERYRLD